MGCYDGLFCYSLSNLPVKIRHLLDGVAMFEELSTFEYKNVLIADPQPVFRLGVVALLASSHPNWDVVEANTLEEHRSRLRTRSIDLLILEGRLLGAELERNNATHVQMNLANDIIAVTEPGDSVGILGCLAAGAHATISRSDPATRMLATIESTMTRRRQAFTSIQSSGTTESSEVLNLTNRQLDVLSTVSERTIQQGHCPRPRPLGFNREGSSQHGFPRARRQQQGRGRDTGKTFSSSHGFSRPLIARRGTTTCISGTGFPDVNDCNLVAVKAPPTRRAVHDRRNHQCPAQTSSRLSDTGTERDPAYPPSRE